MGRLYLCLRDQHDWRLVALAALICIVASGTAVYLVRLTREARGWRRVAALGEAGISIGFGIWATHFVAMLAFHPGVSLGYDLPLTVLSLGVAIALTLCAVLTATLRQQCAAELGGAILGLGIAAMHATGIRALQLPGAPSWSWHLLAASMLVGVGLGAFAMRLAVRGVLRASAFGATAALVLAICGHHFLALGAMDLEDLVRGATSSSPPIWLSAGTVAASFGILILGLIVLDRDRRRRRNAVEVSRIRRLVDAAVEGLVICQRGIIVTANASFADLVGAPAEALEGHPFADWLPPPCGVAWGEIGHAQRFEADLMTTGGRVPVELIARSLEGATPRPGMGTTVGIAIRDLRERRRAEESIRFLAHHDSLTGLHNRASFGIALDEALARARHRSGPLALLCLDLDRFKAVNDAHGHAAGDAVLKAVAGRVAAQLLEGDIFARLGGDEFAILCTGDTAARVEDVAARIVAACAAPIDIGKAMVEVGTSIGIAAVPEGGEDAESLTVNADTALYCAKADGRSTWRRFKPWMRMSADAPELEFRSEGAEGRGGAGVANAGDALHLLSDEMTDIDAVIHVKFGQDVERAGH